MTTAVVIASEARQSSHEMSAPRPVENLAVCVGGNGLQQSLRLLAMTPRGARGDPHGAAIETRGRYLQSVI